MKKKIIAFALVACLSSSFIPAAFAVDNPLPTFKLSLDNWGDIMPGDDITYTVRLSGATGIEQIASILDYDKNVLTFVDAGVKMDYSYSTSSKDVYEIGEKSIQAGITFSGTYNVTDSAMYYVTFKVNEGLETEKVYDEPVSFRAGKNGVKYSGSTRTTITDNLEGARDLYIGHHAAVELQADKNKAVCGEDITLTISFPEEFEAEGFDLNLDVDNNFEFVSAESLINNLQIADNGTRLIVMSTNGNRTFSGDVAKLVFKAKTKTLNSKPDDEYFFYTDAYIGFDDATYIVHKDPKIVTDQDGNEHTVTERQRLIPFNYVNNWIGFEITGSTKVDVTTDKTEVMKGETVHVSVTAHNAKDLQGLQFTLRYDNEAFKLADEPVNNNVPTVIGTANLSEEGYIDYIFMPKSESQYLNGEQELISFDLVATSDKGSYIWFMGDGTKNEGVEGEDYLLESLPAEIVDFVRSVNISEYVGDDDDLTAAQAAINNIPEITAENYTSAEVNDAIMKAEKAIENLSEAKQSKLNKEKLEAALAAVDEFNAQADAAAAKVVSDALAGLSVTDDNWSTAPESIAAVETAYNALTDAQKALVEGYAEKITAAKEAYAEFAKAAADTAAANAAAAAVAEGYINSIGEVTEDSGNAILMAENIYNTLTDDQKALVSDEAKETLTAAREAYDAILAQKAEEEAADAVAAKIDALDVESPTFTADAEAAQAAYDALTDDQKALVTNYADIAAKTAEYAAMADILVTVENIGGSYVVNAKERKSVSEHQIVIAAGYNADDTLKEVKFTTSDNGKVVVSGEKVMTFVWNSVAGMVPYASFESVEK